ncbi:50S ribosomal subunit protein L2 [Candidatus Nasuia deltocephalinicola str. NAS-ALF]|uniref:Large ribosomal subunit protein uL2 n=1 Tax=Candidatus Nasuia deltocephalinicola str. NAS-ALF TaxID=1343077 RepID=S5SQ08_9PROT|nr:50S ribosomal subunit protein L2 [Candidatus Nasuia deltocephalinicola str. NAS-ALF]
MSLFHFKPTTPGLRNKIKLFNNLYKGNSIKKLCKNIISKSGRNNDGRITIRHKGGRLKRYYRFIDFFRNKLDIIGKVERIEYDPNRNSNISLILYNDGERRYIISPKNLNIGDFIISANNSKIKVGNNLLLKNIPNGVKIHCIEKTPGSGGVFARSAGSYATVYSKDLKNVTIILNSGKYKTLNNFCKATIGEVGNADHFNIKFGKAGSKRILGIRPTVRGVAMNPVDHPHGGGEGKTSGGRDPVSPWGKLSKSFKKHVKILKKNTIL